VGGIGGMSFVGVLRLLLAQSARQTPLRMTAKNKQRRRTGNDVKQAKAKCGGPSTPLRCAQNDKQEEARATATARANTEILAAPE
jgi:hypothetical protein